MNKLCKNENCQESVLVKDLNYGKCAINNNRTISVGRELFIYAPYYCEKCGYTEFYNDNISGRLTAADWADIFIG